MLLATFSTLFVLGVSVWLVGHFFQYKGVAAIGGAMLIIAGSAVALTGLVYQDGYVEQVDDVGGANETHYVEPVYKPVNFAGFDNSGALGGLGLGGLVMALGAVLTGQTLAEDI